MSLMKGAALMVCFAVGLAACKPAAPPPAPASAASTAPTMDKLIVNEITVGSGDAITTGQTAVVHYTGWLYDSSAADHKGTQFDSSRSKGQPFRFKIGAGNVIKGWDEGVAGMAVGGRRELIVPAQLGYGDQGAGGVIPPGATLLFDVELLAIEPGQ
ncbi:MAG: FKBP-type peptidyl-prolyl cis-trans isomerase [Povalibacter sp.]